MTTETNELTAAERAAAEALRLAVRGLASYKLVAGVIADDFYARAAVDIAAAAEGHHHVAAYDEASEALSHLAGFHMGSLSADWIDGVNAARKLIEEQAAALRAELAEGTA